MLLPHSHKTFLGAKHTQFPSQEWSEDIILIKKIQTKCCLISDLLSQSYELLPSMEGDGSELIRTVNYKWVVFECNLLLLAFGLSHVAGHLIHRVTLIVDVLLKHVFVDDMISVSHGSITFINHQINHLQVQCLFEPFWEGISQISVHTLEHHFSHFETLTSLIQSQGPYFMECLSLSFSEDFLQT